MNRPQRLGAPPALATALAWTALTAGTGVISCGSDRAELVEPGSAVTRQAENGGARLALTLDRDVLSTVDTATLRLEVETDEADSVEFPDAGDGFGDLAVLREEPAADRLLGSGRVLRARQYVLQPFLPGEYEIPSLVVTLNGTSELATEPITITVESVLEDSEDAELRDISEPVEVPAPWWWWAAALMGVAAVLAAWAWWRRRRSAAGSGPRAIPPHESALAALDALLAGGMPGPESLKDFYLRLSDIVRRYIEERFGLRAPEQTTEEFLVGMAAEPTIRNRHKKLLRGFLGQADLVKFAQLVPDRSEIRSAVEAARRFVRQTAPDD